MSQRFQRPIRRSGAFLILPLVCAAHVSGQTADTVVLTLEEVERRTLEASPALAGALADVEITKARERQANNARFLPEFNLRNVWGPIPRQRGEFTPEGILTSPDTALGLSDLRWFTQLELQIVQPLVGFGKISRRIEAAGMGVEAAEAGLETARSDALLLARELYWGIVLGNELRRVVDDLIEDMEEAEETLEEQVEEGDATQNDLFKFRVFDYEVSRRSREVDERRDLAREGLRALVGLAPGTAIRVAEESLEPVTEELSDLSFYLEASRESRPELQQLRAGIAARRSLALAERRDAWPTLFLAGGLSANLAPDRFDPRNPYWRNNTNYFRPFVLLGMEWELDFMHHRDEARVQDYEARKLEAQFDPLVAKVEAEVREAYLRARRAQADVDEGREALQATDNWLRAELQTYDIGIGDIQDVIDAFQANVQMETQQLQSISELNRAVAELNRRVGRDVVGVRRAP